MAKKSELKIIKCKACGEDVLYYPDRWLPPMARLWTLDRKQCHFEVCIPKTKDIRKREIKREITSINKQINELYKDMDESRTIDNANIVAEKKREVPFRVDKYIDLNKQI
jgi:hypothetical protein